jgi:PXPV repeat (3 copies)
LEKVEMKTKYWIASGMGVLILAASQLASARVSVGVNIGIPAPVYVAPAPVYVAPAPVYAAPAPVYAAPVVAYQPAPVVVIGWHENRYWDGRRWWGRDEWNHHHYHDDHHHDHHDRY